MKHIQKFNEEFFFSEEMENQDSPSTWRQFDKSETGAYRALQKLRSNLDVAIDLLDKQITTKETNPEVLQNVIEKTEEYSRFLNSITGPQNEDFNWGKLNIFSNKKKKELKNKEDDEALAKAIYSTISGKVKGDEITVDLYRSGLTFEYDGDKFLAYTNGISVNGQILDCSKETGSKFYQLFHSKKEILKKEKEDLEKKETTDKLKAKYTKK